MLRVPLSLLCLLLLSPVLAGCVAPDAPSPGVERPDLRAEPARVVDTVVRHTIVDENRWSGEPSILVLDDGTILITGVSGFTRYAEDPTDIPARFGQSYIWRSVNDGESFEFVDGGLGAHPVDSYAFYRNAVMGVEGDLAKDESGNAYFVDLTMLAANGLSSSSDGGVTWTDTQNPVVGQPGTDRPWVAAYGDGTVYVKYLQMTSGFRVARSTDGGMSFLEDVEIPACSQADMTVDVHDQEILIPCAQGKEVSFVRTGPGEMAWERVPVMDAGDQVSGGFPSMAVSFNAYYLIVWVERYLDGFQTVATVSFDEGQTWIDPFVLSAPNRTAIFPWIDANDDGQVGVVWYEADAWGDPNLLDATWTVQHASFVLDPERENITTPVVTQISEGPVHEGAICNGGLGCNLDGRAEDRRLLDFFEIDVTPDGRSHVTWTSTMTDVPTVWYGQVASTLAAAEDIDAGDDLVEG